MNSDSSEVFSKKKRLLSPSDFKFVFTRTKKYSNRFFTILIRKNINQNTSRLGLAISKKSIKFSVQRNRIKRIIREAFRKDMCLNDFNLDIVILAKPSISKFSNAQLKQSLQNLFSKIVKKTD